MAEKVLMLALSPTMERGTVLKWRKKEGDRVASGDVLCEVETDKATMEYESVNEGTLLKLLVPEGKDTKVGEPIAVVGEQGEDISGMLKEVAAGLLSAAAEDATAPAGGPGKTAPALRNAAAPPITAGSPIADSPPMAAAPAGERLPGGVKASPLARGLAGTHGIDIRTVRGSGPDGRVVKRDVEAALTGIAAGGSQRPAAGRSEPPVPVETPFVEVPVSGKRKVIARRLAESMYTAPHYYLKMYVQVENLLKARKALNEGRADAVSLNAFLVRLAAEALKNHPAVNSSWRGETIARFQRADIGLAVAQPDGLLTPIVRDCWNKGISAIDAELKLLIGKALKNTLRPEEYTGATFTISNLGSYGVDEFTAIINPPGSAILAVGKAEKTPVVGEGNLVQIETRMTLTLSCDHRVIDGAEGALFLKDLKAQIEYPIGALL
jgi:pyruvate dehydrogenase E2 component (dihydrolipoamide acetyltransferase)